MNVRVRHLGLALAGVAGLLVTAQPIDAAHVSAAEEAVFRAINDLPDLLHRPLWPVMQLGNLLAAPAVALVALALRRPRVAAACLMLTGAKLLATRTVKDLVVRSRPAAVLDDVVRRDAPAAGQAFVSGHAVVAVALAVIVHPYLGTRGRVAVWTLAALVCIGRVYVGAHLPLDVVGGSFLGVALGSAINAIVGSPRPDQTSAREVVVARQLDQVDDPQQRPVGHHGQDPDVV